MPGNRISSAQKSRFFRLLETGMTVPQAGRQVGISRQSAWRLSVGLDGTYPVSRSIAEAERRDEQQPDPKPWDELDDGAREALRSFSVFAERFLLRRPVPWREDAAQRVVEALQDRSTRSYHVLNMPPGSGKSTLFTMDLVVWLLAGGGRCDPLRGRATRIMLGSFGYKVATHYVGRIARLLESPRPFYDKGRSLRAERSIVHAFGRFKPRQQGIPWKADEFIVEQLEDVDLSEKEPSCQAASFESRFLGERVELAIWDDLVTTANVRSVEVRTELARWYEDEVESRVEPGGSLLLVGQRLSPDDLYRSRLDINYVDDEGVPRRKYTHVKYPAHHEATCDVATPNGSHRQWDAREDGCLLDAERLSWAELQAERASNPRKFQLVYQQLDVDPSSALVDPAWLEGGVDRDGVLAPGCRDEDRGFLEWPQGVSGLVDYVSVDPSAGNFWGIEWWAIQPETKVRYLIRGLRSSRFTAGDLLQWSTSRSDLTGLMQEWQVLSLELHHPIRCWVIEGNSAFKGLVQYDHFRAWQRRHGAAVILHQTQRNKNDEQTGVEALLPPLYRQGLKRLPASRGDMDARGFTIKFAKELTEYPESATKDLVMADWQAEWNMAKILAVGRRATGRAIVDTALPPYLEAKRGEIEFEDALS
ncbi:MAG TPA: hypothetical protein VFA08_01355 [Actinomycetota bacterium]|jgi:hypothetical protein|nr:hypothetical protein [Actinomycetota bacterium]